VVSDPAGGTYPAGTEVSLTAVPDAGWSFTGWSGALSGSQNPATVTVDADLSVSATFELIPDTTPPLISGVGVAASSTSATVTWSTNEPATGAVAYGLTASHELGTTPTSTTGVNHSVTLTNLNPDTTYHYTITATDPSGNTTTTTNTTFTTPAAPAGPAGVFVSDDFAGVGLDAGLWSVVDPVGDGSVSTDGSRLLLSVPAGVSHNAWAGNESLRVMQPASNEDFELEVKFESAPTANYQSDGVLVEASPGNYVRFDLYSASGSLWAFASTTVNGTSSVRTNTSTGPVGVSPSWLRVSRVGNVWKGSYSFDGVTFTQYASFSHSMTVSSVGPFSGNAGSPVPAHTTVVDYFFNTASPIVPEDGTAPDFHTVSTSVTGSGSVVSDPAGGTYPAGTEVSLTAVPDAGWSFTGWSGALSGSQNPATVTVDADLSVSATFELIPDTTPPLISGVGVAASSTSATVTWSTNEPATGAVAYGLTASHELGTTPTSTTGVNHSVTLTNLNPDTTYHYTITATDPSGNTTTTTNTTFTTAPIDTYLLTASVVGSGSVVLDPPGGVYAAGTSVTITAVPAGNWSFVGWSGNVSGTQNPRTVAVAADMSVTATFEEMPDGEAPVIDVWYGDVQSFGAIGTAQNYVNVLGNVSDPDGVASLTYSLNGDPSAPLSIGPDFRRLEKPGDFNIDIHISSLVDGVNEVVIRAVDGVGNVATRSVQLDYTAGSVWPLPYSIDWSTVSEIGDAAQVVDGKWALTPSGLRTAEPGYDRLVAIGDVTWQSYEVTVPITVHEFDEAGAGPYSDLPVIGVLMRWQGHTDDPLGGQPLAGYRPNGNIGFVRDGQLTWYDPSGAQTPLAMQLDVEYTFKLRVVRNVDGTSTYSMKVWRSADSEPGAWQSTVSEGPSDLQSGSLLLLAHHVDATFGDVSVVPVTAS
jgi:hypothetical protein